MSEKLNLEALDGGPAEADPISSVIDRLRQMDTQKEDTQQIPAEPGKKVDAPPVEPPREKSFIKRLQNGEITGDDIPDELREAWTRSILGGVPFSYSVPVLGGRVRFVFTEPGKDDAKFIRKIGRSLSGNVDAQIKLSVLAYLKEIEGDIEVTPRAFERLKGNSVIDTHPSGYVDSAYNDLCDEIPSGIVRFLMGAWSVYSTLTGVLTDNAFPDSF